MCAGVAKDGPFVVTSQKTEPTQAKGGPSHRRGGEPGGGPLQPLTTWMESRGLEPCRVDKRNLAAGSVPSPLYLGASRLH